MHKTVFARLVPLVILLLGATLSSAQVAVEKHLPMDGSIAQTGRVVELRWPDAKPPRVGSVIVNRRTLDDRGADSWQALGPAFGPVLRLSDETVVPGVAYEYQVMRTARDIVDVGYWATGVEVPAVAARGTVYVVVDQTILEDLDAHLRRFERDLTGDGWRVRRHVAPRGNLREPLPNLEAAVSVKQWLATQYARDPFGQHAVILVGHVPIVMSGQAAPDGHKPQAHASDLFYAEMNGQWQATPEGILASNVLPSSTIEMQVGRIDFANVSIRDKAREVALLRAYFDKNHHWRMGLLGELRQAYGQNNNLIAEQYGLRNIVGPQAVQVSGHHDGDTRPPMLWGVDFGHYNGKEYADRPDSKAVFLINFGSAKQKIERPFNPMTALLMQPWYPIAVGWGGRPAWWLHPMALGASIGEVHMRTVNNGVAEDPYRETMSYFPTGRYLWRNPVWVNLLGDPTARAFVLAPPGRVVTQDTDQGVQLSWAASPDADVRGYRIWRADPANQTFVPLDAGVPQEGLSFLDKAPVRNAQYMVRAYGLKDVYAGSFYTFSQGAFSGAGADLAPDMTVQARAGQSTALPTVFNGPQDGKIHAVIEGPVRGALQRSDAGWHYTPPDGFTGAVDLRFSVSDSWGTQVGLLTIIVSE